MHVWTCSGGVGVYAVLVCKPQLCGSVGHGHGARFSWSGIAVSTVHGWLDR